MDVEEPNGTPTKEVCMAVVEEFISRYRKQYDFYDNAARLVAQVLDGSLQAAGIRSIVTSRAKAVTRLEAKVRQRAQTKNYADVDSIYADIVDLAGSRVALYFPAERGQVDKLIKQLFVLTEPPKEFPASSSPSYKKRFSGYWATHYRVQLREQSLNETQKRYSEARIEIQVASVLMHAWSEVEHDLAYKPLEGHLSEEEYAILDELNGLVMAGEIALERLQKAGEARVAAGDRRFANHYDLAAHILNRAASRVSDPLGDAALGRIDLLFELLNKLDLATPGQVEPYLESLDSDTERRPLAEQIIDRLLAEDESRYKLYENIRSTRQASADYQHSADVVVQIEVHKAMGLFLQEWTAFERLVRSIAKTTTVMSRPVFPFSFALKQLIFIAPETKQEIERIRRLRNELVHGISPPNTADLLEATTRLHQIAIEIENQAASIAP
jgi:ppGpp synthetase/RelA/SpoT-type nucleotidyltranferase